MPTQKTGKVVVNYENLTKRYHVSGAVLRKAVTAALRQLKVRQAEVNFRFISDQRMVAENRRYFKINQTTDVISFPSAAVTKPGVRNGFLGDILISLDRARIDCSAYGNSMGEEFLTYVVHGLLHLLGYDDQTKQDQKKMFQKQDGLVSMIITKYQIGRLIQIKRA